MEDADPDKTALVARRSSRPEPAPGGNVLPVGFHLHEYEIEGVIGEGGFGIVYLARDLHLERSVAVKEYMPSVLATRLADYSICVKSERHAETFEAGLRSFVNEARLLAQFDQPALVKVHRFWEDHGTAYMVMPYYRGPTLKQWLLAQPARPPEDRVKALVAPLIDAIESLHEQNVFHRDIAPDNVLLLENGQPLLLDFGAARRIIGDLTQALTAVLKPGYAPLEQYAEVATMRQGPWTDVYALAATLYYIAVDRAPPPAVSRMMNDDMLPAVSVARGRYSEPFLAAIDRGLAVDPSKRPQSMEAFRALLFRGDPGQTDRTHVIAKPPAAAARRAAPASPRDSAVAPGNVPAPATRPAAARVIRIAAAIGMAALCVTAAAWLLLARHDKPTAVANPAPPLPRSEPPAAPPPALASAPQAGAVARALYEARRPDIDVHARASLARLTIDKDEMQFTVRSNRSGYLYVFIADTSNELLMLFPGEAGQDNRIAADRPVDVPGGGYHIVASGPPGKDSVVVVVSPRPRIFPAGLVSDQRPYRRFDLALAAAGVQGRGGTYPVGTVQCPADGAACNDGYGADLVEVEEMAP